jgi:hypothetical protein
MSGQPKKLTKKESNLRLNNNQCVALVNYLKQGCNNLSKAVIDAGYSLASVPAQVDQISNNLAFQQVIKFFGEKSLKEGAGKEGADILKELALTAFFDMKDVFEKDQNGSPKVKDILSMGKESRNIKKIKHTQKSVYNSDGELAYVVDTYEYELWDKLTALRLLGDNLGMFNKKIEDTKEVNEDLLPRIYLPDNGRNKIRVAVEMS